MTAMPPLRPILNNTPASAVDIDWDFQTIEDYVATDLIHRDGSVAMEAPLNLLGPAPSLPTHAITKGYVDTVGIPAGVIWQYAGATAPAGWVFCDGSPKSTTAPEYVALFAAIGYAYGGSSGTFNLPNLQGRFPVGKGTAAPFTALNAPGGNKDAVSIDHGHTQSAHSHGGSSVGSVDLSHNHGLNNHTHDSRVRRGFDVNTANFYGPSNAIAAAGASVAQGTNLYFTLRETAVTQDTVPGGNNQNTGAPNNTTTTEGKSGAGSATPSLTITGEAPAIQRDGVAGTDRNLPPYVVVNFIIRIG